MPPLAPYWSTSAAARAFVTEFQNRNGLHPNALSHAVADTTASGTLIAGADLDRPMLGLIASWLADGWYSLDAAFSDGPPPGGLSEWDWRPRFPFQGSARDRWDELDGWPSTRGSPWNRSEIEVPRPNFGRGSQFSGDLFDPMSRIMGCRWLAVEDHVFVQATVEPPTSALGLAISSVRLLGLDPLRAWAVGMAWKAMRIALERLSAWWTAEQFLPSRRIVGAGTFEVQQVGVGDLLQYARALADGTSGEPVHIFGDGSFDKGAAGSVARSCAIRLAPRAVDRYNRMAPVRDRAVRYWLQSRSGRRSPTWFTDTEVILLAKEIADTAGLLAHEVLHTAWRRAITPWTEALERPDSAGWRIDWHSETGAQTSVGRETNYCQGPDLLDPASIRTYRFSSELDDPLEFVKDARRPDVATRHFTNYLLQAMVTGLLKHEVPKMLRETAMKHCLRDDCRRYATAFPLQCAQFRSPSAGHRP